MDSSAPVFFKGRGLLLHIVAWYARSLEGQHYNVEEHPPFADYVSGVLWEGDPPVDGRFATIPNYPPEQLRQLKKRFPARMLIGMGPGVVWGTPKQHVWVMDNIRRASRNPEIYFNRE